VPSCVNNAYSKRSREKGFSAAQCCRSHWQNSIIWTQAFNSLQIVSIYTYEVLILDQSQNRTRNVFCGRCPPRTGLGTFCNISDDSVFLMWCPKCLLSSSCHVRNVFSLMWCTKCLLSSLHGVRNVSCLPYIVSETSSVFLALLSRTQMSLFLYNISQCFFSLELCRLRSTFYSLPKIRLIRTVVNILCMQVGLLIRTTCLGSTVETEYKQSSKHYNTVYDTYGH
jgi:hypothetical protein